MMQRKDWSKRPSTTSCRGGLAVTSVSILASLMGGAGCSSGGLTPVDAAADLGPRGDATIDRAAEGGPISEAGSDVVPDATPSDGSLDAEGGPACSPRPIWPQNAEGFIYNQSGGFVAPPPPDAGCSGVFVTYQFSVAAMTLSRHGCGSSGRTDLTVQLTQAQALQIVTNLQALQTSCPGRNCGADYPDVVLTVLATSTPPMAYNSDFYAGCNASVMPPFVSYQSLGNLVSLLGSIVTAACQPDGGGPDAGICRQEQSDGGLDGSGADARSCSGTAPNCFGNNTSFCCGNDPSGPAVCNGGAWMCGSAPAPGCNGRSCSLPQDAGTDA